MELNPKNIITQFSYDLKDSKILVVDDVFLLRKFITIILKKEGYNNILQAGSGIEALKVIEDEHPDLVILDLMMPNMGGMEVCQHVRQSEELMHMPIIIQTAMEKNQDRLQAFEVGANDLITKPIDGYELLLRTKVHLQNHFYQKEQALYRHRVAMELSMAREAQFQLLPTEKMLSLAKEVQNIAVSYCFEPSSELGGDFWGIKQINENKIGFHLTDFSGHGVLSALNAMRLHTLLHDAHIDWEKPGEVLNNINASLCDLLTTGQFATILLGTIDTRTNELHYASGAATQPIIGQYGETENYKYLNTSGLPLGVSIKANYETMIVPFPKDSFLFVYSDALTETKHHNREMLDGETLLQLVRDLSTGTQKKEILNRIIKNFKKDCRRPLKDDLTAVCFET